MSLMILAVAAPGGLGEDDLQEFVLSLLETEEYLPMGTAAQLAAQLQEHLGRPCGVTASADDGTITIAAEGEESPLRVERGADGQAAFLLCSRPSGELVDALARMGLLVADAGSAEVIAAPGA